MMDFFISLTVFIFGLITGSFLNSVIYRLEKGESFFKGRSYCPVCRHILGWQDLIPIFSFIFLRGKCRYCQKPISWQYPFVEIATAILFVSFFEIRSPWEIGSLVIVPFLIVIFVYDLKHYIIPDKITYPAIFVSGIWYLVSGIFFASYTRYEILNTIYAAFGAAAFFGAIVLLSRGKWMGMGDVKLAILMGLILGFPNILAALFLAFLLGAIIGIVLIIFGKKTMKSEVPFGPFLVAGTLIALFWGEQLANWYLNLL